LETQSFEFSDYLLDTKERVLLRLGEPVSITPKTFQLLRVLVENHGHIVEKEKIIQSVWADSFVEDGNIAFTMRLLRKALVDDRQNPRFIETVPRRGYRFIADVKPAPAKPVHTNGSSQPQPEIREKTAVSSRRARFLVPLILIVAVGTAFTAFWIGRAGSLTAAPILSTPFVSEKLSTNGKVFSVAMSPDGRKVVYTNRNGGKQSVWLRQLDTASNVELIPPSDDQYYEFSFSPDGDSLYFTRRTKGTEAQSDIFRVPVLGGIPVKIAAETQGWLSLSPNGDKISYARCYYREDEFCSLWIADAADGKNEKMLVSRPRPIRIGDNKISPDGRTIAFAVGQSENAANEFSLHAVDIETGAERELSPEKFFNIKHLAWLPNQSGLLATASRIPNRHFRVWQISAATGEAQPLTKDSENYSVLSLDSQATALATTQIKEDFRLLLFQMADPGIRHALAEATKISFVPDGKILFSSSMSGNSEVWSMSPGGQEQRQLTNNVADDFAPVASFDGNAVFFASNRSGEAQIWQMNPDGSDQVQITFKAGGFPLFASPDGDWLYYHHGVRRTLWRVSLRNGEEQLVWDDPKYTFAFSPDGSLFAFSEKQGSEKFVVIVSIADKQATKRIRYPDSKAKMLEIRWTPDAKNLLYILANSEYEENALWSQPMTGEKPQKIADLGDEEISHFALAPDGKSFAVAQGSWKHDAVLLKGLR
jgi:eukaryotic-like serine/threonine-protein kinase